MVLNSSKSCFNKWDKNPKASTATSTATVTATSTTIRTIRTMECQHKQQQQHQHQQAAKEEEEEQQPRQPQPRAQPEQKHHLKYLQDLNRGNHHHQHHPIDLNIKAIAAAATTVTAAAAAAADDDDDYFDSFYDYLNGQVCCKSGINKYQLFVHQGTHDKQIDGGTILETTTRTKNITTVSLKKPSPPPPPPPSIIENCCPNFAHENLTKGSPLLNRLTLKKAKLRRNSSKSKELSSTLHHLNTNEDVALSLENQQTCPICRCRIVAAGKARDSSSCPCRCLSATSTEKPSIQACCHPLYRQILRNSFYLKFCKHKHYFIYQTELMETLLRFPHFVSLMPAISDMLNYNLQLHLRQHQHQYQRQQHDSSTSLDYATVSLALQLEMKRKFVEFLKMFINSASVWTRPSSISSFSDDHRYYYCVCDYSNSLNLKLNLLRRFQGKLFEQLQENFDGSSSVSLPPPPPTTNIYNQYNYYLTLNLYKRLIIRFKNNLENRMAERFCRQQYHLMLATDFPAIKQNESTTTNTNTTIKTSTATTRTSRATLKEQQQQAKHQQDHQSHHHLQNPSTPHHQSPRDVTHHVHYPPPRRPHHKTLEPCAKKQKQKQKHLSPFVAKLLLQLSLMVALVNSNSIRKSQQATKKMKSPPHAALPKLSYKKVFLILMSFMVQLVPGIVAETSAIARMTEQVERLYPSGRPLLSAESSFGSSEPNPMLRPLSLSSTKENTTVGLSKRERVCKSMDLRNSFEYFNAIANCTVIEGFLLVGLVSQSNQLPENLSFPLLTEVTEFVLVYRLHFIRSLGQLFPNLAIIRGRELFEGYALAIFSNPAMEEVGLTKLIAIERGGVIIKSNNRLCYGNSIDWKQIVYNTTEKIDVFDNRNEEECQQCPGSNKKNDDGNSPNELVCNLHNGRRWCWNSQACQTICPRECPNNCFNSTLCCDEACVGGCTTNPKECTACRNYSILNSTCISSCPSNYFQYLGRRCITAQDCLNIRHKFQNSKQETLVAFNRTCSTNCPNGYEKINSTCVPCIGDCHKSCVGGEVDSVARAKEFHGCTEIIQEGLTISIKLGGPHVFKELEYGFGTIKVIHTFLKVQRTYSIPSLGFFKNLKNITGDVLDGGRFALYVLENNDLEKIWQEKQKVYINKGRVFFHFNPKLCYSVIEAIRPMMGNNTTYDKSEVATDSNGSRGSCNTTLLILKDSYITSTTVALNVLNPLQFPDERTLIGYQFFYKETAANVTKHSYRPCDDSWTVTDPKKDPSILIQNLKPFTRYAFYVKTMTISSEPRNGESGISYFKTLPDIPKKVGNLFASSNSSSEIVVSWKPPSTFNGEFEKYVVVVREEKTFENENRDYCEHHIPNVEMFPAKPNTEKPPIRPGAGGTTTDETCNCNENGKPGSSTNNNLDENYDEKIHQDIDFENAVHNFVYVKKGKSENGSRGRSLAIEGYPRESLLVRTTRDLKTNHVDDEKIKLLSENYLKSIQSSGFNSSKLDGNLRGFNGSRFDSTIYFNMDQLLKKADDEEDDTKEIRANVTTNEYVIKGLEHFTVYSVAVMACRKSVENEKPNTQCSEPAIKEVRTMKMENVDKVKNVEVLEMPTNSTNYGSARIKWDPPDRPNGRVVSYTIQYKREAQDEAAVVKCINITLYNKTHGYELTKLAGGNYSVSVRANTLAGEGIFSEKKYFNVDLPTGPEMKIILILVLVVFTLLIICCFVLMRKKLGNTPELKIFSSVNPYYVTTPYMQDEWEIPRERIIQLGPLGQGSFGMVYEGILKGTGDEDGSKDTPCAIKTVNESATDRERIKFLDEASVMKQFDTHHVVHLLGVCSAGQPALVVMELMKKGDLKNYLRQHRPENNRDETVLSTFGPVNLPEPPPSLDRILLMAIQIADGMAYLAAKKFVHRDLAARNCMVAFDLTVKIGDFGMTRDIYETDYYRKGTKGLLPVRWMAPESLKDGVYSSSSDVFSYGVVLWEMATLAAQPYQGLSNDQVLRYVIDGGVMERPDSCPDPLYNLMQKCWHHRPTARPSFLDIVHMLYDYSDENFRNVSFYNSSSGRNQLIKERNELYITDDQDNFADDATTPLHVGDFSGYKMNLANQSSVEHIDESSIITAEDEDEHLHSPNSLVSGLVINSASDGQSKNSFNLSHKLLHGGGANSGPPQYSSGLNMQHQRHPQFQMGNRQGSRQQSFPMYNSGNTSIGGNETDEKGYEMYDPSPNYREHVVGGGAGGSYDHHDDDNDDTAGQHLLPLPKNSNTKRQPQIISSSMPNEGINSSNNQMIASSLHPSTASAASSNTSSIAAGGGGGGASGKFQSLKDAATENLIPRFRFRNIFNHKRSNSNSSHKSYASNTNKNYPTSTQQQMMQQSNQSLANTYKPHVLTTIESGGSGSAGSYTTAETTPTAKGNTSTTNANKTKTNSNNSLVYKPLDESINISGISAVSSTPYSHQKSSKNPYTSTSSATPSATASATATASASLVQQAKPKQIPLLNFTTSTNPNYQFLDNSNSSSSSTVQKNKTAISNLTNNSSSSSTSNNNTTIPFRELSENPNYVMMTTDPSPPSPPPLSSPSPYVMPSSLSFSKLYENDNEATEKANAEPDANTAGELEHRYLQNDDEMMKETTKTDTKRNNNKQENIQMTPILQQRLTSSGPMEQHQQRSSMLNLKEKWLRDQQQQYHKHKQQQQQPPPPNGFVGPDS